MTVVDGSTYYFDSKCRMHTGPLKWNAGGWSVFDGEGRNYAVDGYLLRWAQVIDGKTYYFDSECRMVTGWVKWKADGKWSYFGFDGAMYTGTHTIDGVTYTFDADGKTTQYFARAS